MVALVSFLGLQLIHPSSVGIEVRDGIKYFRIQLDSGRTSEYTDQIVHIPGPSTDGIKGMNPITLARNPLGTSIAGEGAAARLFSSGALMLAIATVDEELSEDDAKPSKRAWTAGWPGEANAGQIALINGKVTFTRGRCHRRMQNFCLAGRFRSMRLHAGTACRHTSRSRPRSKHPSGRDSPSRTEARLPTP